MYVHIWGRSNTRGVTYCWHKADKGVLFYRSLLLDTHLVDQTLGVWYGQHKADKGVLFYRYLFARYTFGKIKH
jgi:hypothetical protein